MNLGISFTDHLQKGKPKRSKKTAKLSLSHQGMTYSGWINAWRWRALPLVCLGIAALVMLAGRLWQLQIIQGPQQRQAALYNSYAFEIIPAPRGLIYDRKGVVAARNESTFQVAVTASLLPKDAANKRRVLELLSQKLRMTSQQIDLLLQEASTTPFFPVTLKTNLDRDTEISLLAIKDDLPGVTIGQDLRRSYPLGPSFSHLLGYTGRISLQDRLNPLLADLYPGEAIGKMGLEQMYDAQLRGAIGKKFSQVNAQGRPQSVKTAMAPQSGHAVTLSIDSALQQKVYQLLAEASEKYKTTGAVAVIQQPSTGKVLSLVSLPSFDNNAFAKGIDLASYQSLISQPGKPLFNRTVSGTYPPGSMVKPLVAAAAINERVITPTTIINSPSYISVGSFRYADWTFWEGRAAPGPINVIQAIAQSCDTFFYQIGGGYQQQAGLGLNQLHKYYTQAGLGNLTGIDLPGEVPGVSPDQNWKKKMFPDDPNWYIGNTYQLAIGQSYLLTTPVQMNNLTAAIANGGKLLKPQIVDTISDTNGKVIQKFRLQVLRNQITAAPGLAIAQQGMRQAVENGIIYPLRQNKLLVAAKTGTAEFGTPNAQGQYQTHSWVTGYAPYDKPEIAFTILLESGGSSTNAAEVANQIITWYSQYQNDN